MTKKLKCSISAVPLVVALLIATETQAIVNGERINDGELLARVSLALHFKTVSGKNQYCSSVVIRPNVLLTSAHCVVDDTPKVLLGTFVQRKGSAEPSAASVEVADVFVNETYRKTAGQDQLREDIALILLKEPLPKPFQPAKMELEDRAVARNFKISGFGAQTPWGNKRNFFSVSEAAENVELRAKEATTVDFDREVIQIHQPGGGLCLGDSGGGAFEVGSLADQRPIVIAINMNAGSASGPTCQTEAFLLRLSSKREWIQATLKSIEAQSAAKTPASDK